MRENKTKRGRPPGSTKIIPELVENIEGHIRAGLGIYDACKLCGNGYTTAWRYCQRGKDAKEGIYADFFWAVNCVREERYRTNVEAAKPRLAKIQEQRASLVD